MYGELRVPNLHDLAHKGEHAFHSSYLAFEAYLGHPPLSQLAGLILLCILLQAGYALFVHQ